VTALPNIPFDNRYVRLPERFYAKQNPEAARAPSAIRLNAPLAEELRLDADSLAAPEGLDVLAGNRVPEGAEPIAMAYAGHQFGRFVPQLGDGRALLLGEVLDAEGQRRDLQLKGSGRTPFSRGGDGRAWIDPVIREYIVSEAMHALGIPTTRALAAVRTGEPVFRETALPGAVLTRVAASHIRVGTFEYFAARGDGEAVRQLADHAIARHYPDIAGEAEPYRAFLGAVARRQAALVAEWLRVGFIHGVMNTDNMAISGETLDYGPCAFMDAYDPNTVFSSIDRGGRYAYDQQPGMAQWNLARLAETLLPLLDSDENKATAIANETLDEAARSFREAWRRAMRAKLGLFAEEDGDSELAQNFLDLLARNAADFTRSFRALGDLAETSGENGFLQTALGGDGAWPAWRERWRRRLERQPQSLAQAAERMRRHNPARIPRNHSVERAIREAVERGDDAFMREMIEASARPYEDSGGDAFWNRPPEPEERVARTFCGT